MTWKVREVFHDFEVISITVLDNDSKNVLIKL